MPTPQDAPGAGQMPGGQMLPAGVRSVPHQSTALPADRPQRAGTVYGHPTSGNNNMGGHHRDDRRDDPHGTPRRGKSAPSHGQLHGPADSYLDRVDHDPRVQALLAGTRNKTIHSSAYPPSSFQGHDRARSVSAPGTDKPLPQPNNPARAHTTKHHSSSRAGTAVTGPAGDKSGKGGGRGGRRFSLMDDLHHGHAKNGIKDGDRYPPFPHHPPITKEHSRQDSINTVDPTQYALPM